MPIEFSFDRWAAVKENARQWWAGRLDRPLIQITLSGRDPGRPAPKLRYQRRTAQYGWTATPPVTAAELIDRWDYELSTCRYLGDAFPSRWPDFGPGIMAGFIGGQVHVDERTVWFMPDGIREIKDIRFRRDPQSAWFERVRGIYRAGVERWGGLAQLGMTDLGGNLDVLSTFRPSERLLLDLLLEPEHVKRLTWEAHALWWEFYDELNAALQPVNPGYTAWAPIYSELPYYMLQCDFCYMIGPEHFDEFVKPELAASCRRLGNAFYHLDGPGQLPHLDSLLTIPELKGVQWVPGAGNPDCAHWPEVYRKIRRAGKLAQIVNGPAEFDAIVEQLGSAEGLVLVWSAPKDQEEAVRAFLKKYGVPATA